MENEKCIISLYPLKIGEEKDLENLLISVLKEFAPLKREDISITSRDNKCCAYITMPSHSAEQLLKREELLVDSQKVPIKKYFPNHQLFIPSLPYEINEELLQKHFSEFGKVLDVSKVISKNDKGYQQRFYIKFEENKALEKVFNAWEHKIGETNIRVARNYTMELENDVKLSIIVTDFKGSLR